MVRKKEMTYRIKKACARFASVLFIALFAMVSSSSGFAYAAASVDSSAPIRESHAVGVENKTYCFFVTKNVVLTPAEIADLSDEELVSVILDRAGLYMKETNCKKASHKTITVANWKKRGGGFLLSDPDVEGIREAKPAEGKPVKFYMDLLVTPKYIEKAADDKDKSGADSKTEEEIKAEDGSEDESKEDSKAEEGSEDESKEDPKAEEGSDDESKEDPKAEDESADEPKEEPKDEPQDDTKPEDEADPEQGQVTETWYSTFKLTTPGLIFVAVATEEDAKYVETICKEETKAPQEQKPPKFETPDSDGLEDETLPEYRTITMVDRSGAPIEDTLADGTPVTLEWKEPGRIANNDDSSFFGRFPGGIAGFAAAACAAAAAVIAIIAGVKRRKTEE